MGRVRTELVKRIAQELVGQYPDKFSKDFENNKKLVDSLTTVSSARLRNKIAGYITRLSTPIEEAQASELEATV
ncbi:MAG: 30S ribosomal protein S17e [Candidatus Bathyarchaeota archaeon]|nr:MAG: 30S ribosomal protein S17e [Candidatus Bathyarchaeota archaeon]